MSAITTRDLRLISTESNVITVQASDWESPIKCQVRQYEGGVVIQIAWVHRDRLGGPDYGLLKRLLYGRYKGIIGTRTQTNPKVVRSAEAREQKTPAPGRAPLMLTGRKSS